MSLIYTKYILSIKSFTTMWSVLVNLQYPTKWEKVFHMHKKEAESVGVQCGGKSHTTFWPATHAAEMVYALYLAA